MSREKNLLPLMSAVSKMTYQYAKFFADNGVAQMAHKGPNLQDLLLIIELEPKND